MPIASSIRFEVASNSTWSFLDRTIYLQERKQDKGILAK